MLLDDTILGVVGMNALALLLVVGRAGLFRTRVYRPMLLNVGLSVAPVLVLGAGVLLLAVLTAVGLPRGLTAGVAVVVLLVWLLLLPNAGYLVTELNLTHRRPGEKVPEWYDVLLVLSLAMSGVLNMLMNVFLVQLAYAAVRFNEVGALEGAEIRAITVAVLVLAAFGVHIGRNVRVNSWDVLHPWSLVAKVLRHLRVPANARAAAGFTVTCATFFGLMYLVVIGPLVRAVLLLGA